MIAGSMSLGDADIADWNVGVRATGDAGDECGSVSMILATIMMIWSVA
jgi:hypothetical protein